MSQRVINNSMDEVRSCDDIKREWDARLLKGVMTALQGVNKRLGEVLFEHKYQHCASSDPTPTLLLCRLCTVAQ